MIEDVFSADEFARLTTNKKNRNRALFANVDKALAAAHKDDQVQNQISSLQALLKEISAFQDRYARFAARLRDQSLYRQRSTVVAQLEQQAKTALEALQRQVVFEKAALQLSQQSRQNLPKYTLPDHEPITQDFLFDFALRKAKDAQEIKSILDRSSPGVACRLVNAVNIQRIDALLNASDMQWFAVHLITAILTPPDGSTNSLLRCWRPNRVKQEVIRCLSPMVTYKPIAMELLRKKVRIVVLPRNRYLTDLPMFAHLKDVICRGGGRVWNSTRGVGDVSHGGFAYLACTEENLMGYPLDSGLKRHHPEKTTACPVDHVLDSGSPRNYYTLSEWGAPIVYDEGYSTTIHEFAHIIHRQAMSAEDSKRIKTHFEKWRRGLSEQDLAERTFRLPTLSPQERSARNKLHREIALHRIGSLLKRRNLTSQERADLADLTLQHVFSPTSRTPKQELQMGWEWVDGPIGLTDTEIERRKKDEQRDRLFDRKLPAVQRDTEVTVLGKKVKVHEVESVSLPRYMASLPHDGSPACYASSHVEEYFAQLSCCWLEANGGDDPYTDKPRKNSQAWVRDNEPRPIVELLERLYGNATVPNTNPLSKPL